MELYTRSPCRWSEQLINCLVIITKRFYVGFSSTYITMSLSVTLFLIKSYFCHEMTIYYLKCDKIKSFMVATH